MAFRVIDKGTGINKAISISNTRKMTAKRKNRREKGIRADDLGSKPHSKGVDFSWFGFFFIGRMSIIAIIIVGSRLAIKVIVKEAIISLE